MRPESVTAQSLGFNVSRETEDALGAFCGELLRWSKSINLVSETTHDDAWDRHIVDSLQISRHLADKARWVDIGSGGGLPAIPLAIVAKELAKGCRFFLVESDRRKAAFLKTQIHKFSLNAEVITKRSEQIEPLLATVVSARAFASLNVVLSQAFRHLGPAGVAVLHKGRTIDAEIAEARKNWDFEFRIEPSVVQGDSVILTVQDISRRAVAG